MSNDSGLTPTAFQRLLMDAASYDCIGWNRHIHSKDLSAPRQSSQDKQCLTNGKLATTLPLPLVTDYLDGEPRLIGRTLLRRQRMPTFDGEVRSLWLIALLAAFLLGISWSDVCAQVLYGSLVGTVMDQ